MKYLRFIHPCNWCGKPYESVTEPDPDLIALILWHSICSPCYAQQERARDMEG